MRWPRFVCSRAPNDQRVEADDLLIGHAEIGFEELQATLQGMSDEEVVEIDSAHNRSHRVYGHGGVARSGN